MFDQSNGKLQCVKNRLEQLIAELDVLIKEARGLHDTGPAQNSSAGDPHWILQIARQREVLATVRDLLADSTFDSTRMAE